MTENARTLRTRLADFYERHHRVFWALHSLWALLTGIVVVVLAHESYGYAAWVLGFLVLMWASTLFFSRAAPPPEEDRGKRLKHEFVSYLTRIMYQETLFFLLPFYYYSTTLDSANVLFFALLVALAVLACLDLVFDELLRSHRWFGFFFFATVSFAALNFLLPLVLGVRIELATAIAAVAGLLAAVPMVQAPEGGPRWRTMNVLVIPAVVTAGLLLWLRFLVPPVPLQLEDLTFARDVHRETLEPIAPLSGTASLSEGADRLGVIASVSAPRRVAVRVELAWSLDGEELATSREVEITPHEGGFKVWDLYSPGDAPLAPGRYEVSARTTNGQLIGRGRLRLVE